MKIKLKAEYAQTLDEKGKVHLPLNRSLEIYRPQSPKHNIEVLHRTEEGRALMEQYYKDRDKWYVAIVEPRMNGDYELSDATISPVQVFNTRAQAIETLTGKGIDCGFMPLQALANKIAGHRSPVVIL